MTTSAPTAASAAWEMCAQWEEMDAATIAAISAVVASVITTLTVVFRGGRLTQSVQHLAESVAELKVSVEGVRREQVEQGKAIAELKGHVFAPAPRVHGEVNT